MTRSLCVPDAEAGKRVRERFDVRRVEHADGNVTRLGRQILVVMDAGAAPARTAPARTAPAGTGPIENRVRMMTMTMTMTNVIGRDEC